MQLTHNVQLFDDHNRKSKRIFDSILSWYAFASCWAATPILTYSILVINCEVTASLPSTLKYYALLLMHSPSLGKYMYLGLIGGSLVNLLMSSVLLGELQ